MICDWDPAKATSNFVKHGVEFRDAATVFMDPLAVTYTDPDHSYDESREITIGRTIEQGLVFVSHNWRGDQLRIIGARFATRSERKQYEEGSNRSRRKQP